MQSKIQNSSHPMSSGWRNCSRNYRGRLSCNASVAAMNFDGENLILTFRSDDKVVFELFRVSGPEAGETGRTGNNGWCCQSVSIAAFLSSCYRNPKCKRHMPAK